MFVLCSCSLFLYLSFVLGIVDCDDLLFVLYFSACYVFLVFVLYSWTRSSLLMLFFGLGLWSLVVSVFFVLWVCFSNLLVFARVGSLLLFFVSELFLCLVSFIAMICSLFFVFGLVILFHVLVSSLLNLFFVLDVVLWSCPWVYIRVLVLCSLILFVDIALVGPWSCYLFLFIVNGVILLCHVCSLFLFFVLALVVAWYCWLWWFVLCSLVSLLLCVSCFCPWFLNLFFGVDVVLRSCFWSLFLSLFFGLWFCCSNFFGWSVIMLCVFFVVVLAVFVLCSCSL